MYRYSAVIALVSLESRGTTTDWNQPAVGHVLTVSPYFFIQEQYRGSLNTIRKIRFLVRNYFIIIPTTHTHTHTHYIYIYIYIYIEREREREREIYG